MFVPSVQLKLDTSAPGTTELTNEAARAGEIVGITSSPVYLPGSSSTGAAAGTKRPSELIVFSGSAHSVSGVSGAVGGASPGSVNAPTFTPGTRSTQPTGTAVSETTFGPSPPVKMKLLEEAPSSNVIAGPTVKSFRSGTTLFRIMPEATGYLTIICGLSLTPASTLRIKFPSMTQFSPPLSSIGLYLPIRM